jgi:hypothetical protein
MFVVVLTLARGSGRLMTSPDIISRGFIYLRDSEELMGMIRQYLKQKVARIGGKRIDMDVLKKELKDEITHILYDQTRRTPIVIPVINEIGGGGNGGQKQEGHQPRQQQGRNGGPHRNNGQNRHGDDHVGLPPRGDAPLDASGAPAVRDLGLETKTFPAPMVPDTEANEPKKTPDARGY